MIDNEKNKNTNSHFLTGVAIGAALTALFTTKTGRRIVKELTSNGTELLEGRVDIEKIVQRVKHAQDEDDGELEIIVEEDLPTPKRVFKGVKKK